MAKINIGASHDQSTTKLRVELHETSQLELDVGDSHDMSLREIEIVEKQADAVRAAGAELRAQAAATGDEAVRAEADKVATAVERAVAERRWYDISAKGLVEAAKAVGETASPLVATAIKLIELMQKARAG